MVRQVIELQTPTHEASDRRGELSERGDDGGSQEKVSPHAVQASLIGVVGRMIRGRTQPCIGSSAESSALLPAVLCPPGCEGGDLSDQPYGGSLCAVVLRKRQDGARRRLCTRQCVCLRTHEAAAVVPGLQAFLLAPCFVVCSAVL